MPLPYQIRTVGSSKKYVDSIERLGLGLRLWLGLGLIIILCPYTLLDQYCSAYSAWGSVVYRVQMRLHLHRVLFY